MTARRLIASPGPHWLLDLEVSLGPPSTPVDRGFCHATQPALLKAELLLDHPETMLTLGAYVSIGRFNQIRKPAFWRIGQG